MIYIDFLQHLKFEFSCWSGLCFGPHQISFNFLQGVFVKVFPFHSTTSQSMMCLFFFYSNNGVVYVLFLSIEIKDVVRKCRSCYLCRADPYALSQCISLLCNYCLISEGSAEFGFYQLAGQNLIFMFHSLTDAAPQFL